MSVESGMSENHDRARSKNYSLGVTHGEPGNCASGRVFVNSLTDGGAYKSVGGNLAVEKAGLGGHLNALHSPGSGDQVSAGAKMNLMHANDHKVDVNAFATHTALKNHPSFTTHGGGVNYAYKDTLGASASVAHTPMFKKTDYNVGTSMTLHQTPSSAMNLNLGASRTDFPNHRGNWQRNVFFGVRKDF